VADPKPLRPKQHRFVEEYLLDFNATQAALRAGYSAKTARVIGPENLSKPAIQHAIRVALHAQSTRVQLTQEGILEELHILSHSDITHYSVNAHGDVILTPGAPPQAMRAVASLKKRIVPTEHGLAYETEIRLWNKPASVRMAGEHLGTFRDGTVDSTQVQAAQRDRRLALQGIRGQLTQIAARHRQGTLEGSNGAVTP